jgi:hypothetical protein
MTTGRGGATWFKILRWTSRTWRGGSPERFLQGPGAGSPEGGVNCDLSSNTKSQFPNQAHNYDGYRSDSSSQPDMIGIPNL